MYHMLKEINTEPDLVRKYTENDFTKATEIYRVLRESNISYILGNGSSYHAAVYLSILLNRRGINSTPMISSEVGFCIGHEGNKRTAVIFSQSGNSIDAVKAAEFLKSAGIRIIAITNTEGSRLSELSDISYYTEAGEELSVAATKSHLSQLLASLTIAYAEDSDTIVQSLDKVRINYAKIVRDAEKIKNAADTSEKMSIFLGSGLLYPLALESSLKLTETSNVISKAFPVREFLHGPKQLLDQKWSVFILSRDEEVGKELLGYTKSVTDVERFLSENFGIDEDDEIVSSLTTLMFIQLFSYYTSTGLGLNPDKPTKLSKVVR